MNGDNTVAIVFLKSADINFSNTVSIDCDLRSEQQIGPVTAPATLTISGTGAQAGFGPGEMD